MDAHLTAIQLTVKTGIPKNTLAKWRHDGKGPKFVKLGTRVVYPLTDLEAWLLTQKADRITKEENAQCSERERLLQDWIYCSGRLRLLQNEELAALKRNDPAYTNVAVMLARTADAEACRVYNRHVDQHKCVALPRGGTNEKRPGRGPGLN